MDQRIKEIRKHIGCTQAEFAKKLGVPRDSIASYESGRRMPSAAMLALICKEFHVNERWLRMGEGEMFVSDTRSKLDDLAAAHGLGPEQRILIEKFIMLKPEAQQAVLDYITDVVDSIRGISHEDSEDISDELSSEDLHAALDRHIAMEKEAEEKSGVS